MQRAVSRLSRWALWLGVSAVAAVAGARAGESQPDWRDADRRLDLSAGGIVRGPKGEKKIALVFNGHTFHELLDYLALRGYQFARVDELLGTK